MIADKVILKRSLLKKYMGDSKSPGKILTETKNFVLNMKKIIKVESIKQKNNNDIISKEIAYSDRLLFLIFCFLLIFKF